MKILVVDCLYPNRYSQWRNVEITSFIKQYQADVLVYKTNNFAGQAFDVDFDHNIYHGLHQDYNILIFDPQYNYCNQFNRRLDGTEFNNLHAGSYVLTQSTDFDIQRYDAVYHIFLGVYQSVNRDYRVPFHKQFIHLYPGGGLASPIDLTKIDTAVKLITTHPDSTHWAQSRTHMQALLGPFLEKDQVILTNVSKQRLGICFSSLGHGHAKGDMAYLAIAEYYKTNYPNHAVDFYSVGNCSRSAYIKHFDAMDFRALSNFYKNHIDLYVNLETGADFNGWPLGIEAAVQGAVLLTTDSRQSATKYQVPDKTFFISNRIAEIVNGIKQFYENKTLLQEYSINTQAYLTRLISYQQQQSRIFDFIQNA